MASAAARRSTSGFLGTMDSPQDDASAWLGPNSIFSISKKYSSISDKPLKEEDVYQLCHHKWIKRTLIVTANSLFATRLSDERIVEEISWADVQEVSSCEPEMALHHYREHNTHTKDLLTREIQGYLHPGSPSNRDFVFQVHIGPTIFRGEHTLFFSADSDGGRDEWLCVLREQWRTFRGTHWAPACVDIAREKITAVYNSNVTQGVIAILIFANFVTNAIQAQFVPDHGSEEEQMYERLDLAFTIAFTIELVANILVHWFWAFFQDGWNVFDLFVVSTSLISLALEGLPGVSILRIVRAFRVLRLFGRLGSLRRIINALTCSWLPVLNAFAVVMFITAVYAILGVTFFRDRSMKHFGSFTRAFVTMFTVTTTEGWVDLMEDHLAVDGETEGGAVVFFISFILIVVWTMLPVVVAILLDNFTMAATKEEAKADEARMTGTKAEMFHALDPLMSVLAMFTSENELRVRISELFQLLNKDEKEALSYEDLRHGFSMLHLPDITLDFTYEDFMRMTKHGAMCDEQQRLGVREFERIIVRELRDFTERGIASAMALEMVNGSPGMVAALCSLKIQGLEFDNDYEEIEILANEKERRRQSVMEGLDASSHGMRRRSSIDGGREGSSPLGLSRRRGSISAFFNGSTQNESVRSKEGGSPTRGLNERASFTIRGSSAVVARSDANGSNGSPETPTRSSARSPRVGYIGSGGSDDDIFPDKPNGHSSFKKSLDPPPNMLRRTTSVAKKGLFGHVKKPNARSAEGDAPRQNGGSSTPDLGGSNGNHANGHGSQEMGYAEVVKALANLESQHREILGAIAQLRRDGQTSGQGAAQCLCPSCSTTTTKWCASCGTGFYIDSSAPQAVCGQPRRQQWPTPRSTCAGPLCPSVRVSDPPVLSPPTRRALRLRRQRATSAQNAAPIKGSHTSNRTSLSRASRAESTESYSPRTSAGRGSTARNQIRTPKSSAEYQQMLAAVDASSGWRRPSSEEHALWMQRAREERASKSTHGALAAAKPAPLTPPRSKSALGRALEPRASAERLASASSRVETAASDWSIVGGSAALVFSDASAEFQSTVARESAAQPSTAAARISSGAQDVNQILLQGWMEP